ARNKTFKPRTRIVGHITIPFIQSGARAVGMPDCRQADSPAGARKAGLDGRVHYQSEGMTPPSVGDNARVRVAFETPVLMLRTLPSSSAVWVIPVCVELRAY